MSPVEGITNRAFTLIELLFVVAILGIASALVLPTLAPGGMAELQLRAATQTLQADIYYLQALARSGRPGEVFALLTSTLTPSEALGPDALDVSDSAAVIHQARAGLSENFFGLVRIQRDGATDTIAGVINVVDLGQSDVEIVDTEFGLNNALAVKPSTGQLLRKVYCKLSCHGRIWKVEIATSGSVRTTDLTEAD